MDIAAEEFHNSVPAAAALHGQVADVASQLAEACDRLRTADGGGDSGRLSAWWQRLREKAAANQLGVKVREGEGGGGQH